MIFILFTNSLCCLVNMLLRTFFVFSKVNFYHENNGLSPLEKQIERLHNFLWKTYTAPPEGSPSILCVISTTHG